jgi:hypothetical protein
MLYLKSISLFNAVFAGATQLHMHRATTHKRLEKFDGSPHNSKSAAIDGSAGGRKMKRFSVRGMRICINVEVIEAFIFCSRRRTINARKQQHPSVELARSDAVVKQKRTNKCR